MRLERAVERLTDCTRQETGTNPILVTWVHGETTRGTGSFGTDNLVRVLNKSGEKWGEFTGADAESLHNCGTPI